MKTHYDVLGVPQNADPETVKAAYRKIVKAFHPDVNGAGDDAQIRSRQIIAAYAVLKDAEERARYDEQLRRRRGRVRLLVITALVSAGFVSAFSLYVLNAMLEPDASARSPAAPAETIALVQDDTPAAPEVELLPPAETAALPAEGAEISPVAAHSEPSLEKAVPQPELTPAQAPHETAWLAVEPHNAEALWVFIQHYPGTPQAALAAKRLEPLIDAIDNAASLRALGARATGRVAERVSARLAQLTAADVDSTASLPEPAAQAAQSEAAFEADAGSEDDRVPDAGSAAFSGGDGAGKLASADPQAAVHHSFSLTSAAEDVMAPFARESAPMIRGNPKYHLHRAGYWASKGDLDRALTDFDAAIMADGVNIDAFHGRAMLRLQRGEVELALADLDRAIRLSFADPKIYIDRGLIWYRRGGYDRAIADFNQAIKLAPHLGKAYLYRGRALRRKREFKLAIADLDQAIRLNPEIAEAHRNLDLARTEKDDAADAASDLAR